MKKLLFFLSVLCLGHGCYAQTAEELRIIASQKGKTFGDYGRRVDTLTGPTVMVAEGKIALSGIVLSTGKLNCVNNNCTANTLKVKKDDGTIVSIGTSDYGFTIPKEIVGRRITVEGTDAAYFTRERKTIKKDYQKDIQIAASGIKIID